MIDIQEILGRERGLKLKIARALNITHGAVSQWRAVPPARAIEVSKITGIPPHELCPKVFPDPATEEKKTAGGRQ